MSKINNTNICRGRYLCYEVIKARDAGDKKLEKFLYKLIDDEDKKLVRCIERNEEYKSPYD